MKRVVWTMFLILLFSCTALAGPKKKFLGDGDDDTTTTLDDSTVAVIELWSNPSTGFGWRAQKPYGRNIRILGSEFESSKPGMKGAWGKEKIYVVGTSKGRSKLVMQYRRGATNNIMDTVKFNFKTLKQFKESFTVPSTDVQTKSAPVQSSVRADLGLPTAFNWCDQGGCAPVKDQGSCGSCWAFATTVPLEHLIRINDGVTVDLSEQYLISCNSEGWGCNGGLWAHDYHQWKKVSGESEAGAVLEADFPYRDSDTACNPPHDKAYKIASWEYVCGNAYCTPTTEQLKQAIYEHGPLTVSVCVNMAFQFYNRGVFNGPGCRTLNHGVVLVGWDDNEGCWIMQNSWGKSWGESGFMRIKYGVSGIGSEACYVTYGSSPEPDDDNTDPEPEPDDPNPETDVDEITNGQTIANLSADRGEWLYYYIDVPQNATSLSVQISGGSGNANVYLRQDAQPTTTNYDRRTYQWRNDEICQISMPQSGQWYIGLYGQWRFSGVNLTATYN